MNTKTFPVVIDCALRAMLLADTALYAVSRVYYRPGGKGVLENSPCPLGETPFKMLLGRKTEAADGALFQRIAKNPDAVQIRFTDTCRRSSTDKRQFSRVHTDQSGAHNINSDRIPAGDNRADLAGIAAAGAIALHADDCVHNGKPRPED